MQCTRSVEEARTAPAGRERRGVFRQLLVRWRPARDRRAFTRGLAANSRHGPRGSRRKQHLARLPSPFPHLLAVFLSWGLGFLLSASSCLRLPFCEKYEGAFRWGGRSPRWKWGQVALAEARKTCTFRYVLLVNVFFVCEPREAVFSFLFLLYRAFYVLRSFFFAFYGCKLFLRAMADVW